METAPAASFELLIAGLVMQAQMGLGLFAMPGEEPQPDLAAAKYAIDMLGVLEEKTKGNLTLEEERALQNSLTELRFRYLSLESK
jgi:hypothetical protein